MKPFEPIHWLYVILWLQHFVLLIKIFILQFAKTKELLGIDIANHTNKWLNL